MGILATLRERIRATPDEPNVVIDDDEFDALIKELKGRSPEIVQDDGGSPKPMTLYGRLVVAPDGSPRSTRTPDEPFTNGPLCDESNCPHLSADVDFSEASCSRFAVPVKKLVGYGFWRTKKCLDLGFDKEAVRKILQRAMNEKPWG